MLFIPLSILDNVTLAAPNTGNNVLDSLKDICVDGEDYTEENGNKGSPAICDVSNTQTKTQNVLVGKEGVITRLTKVLIWISGSLAMIMIIISGLMFMLSSGNPESASKAKRTTLYAVVGTVVAVIAQLVVTYVLNKL